MDEDTAVAEAYGAINLPSTFFINADGEVTAVHRGILTKGQAEDYLAETIQ
jgi:peroxiredoxin